MCRMQITKQAVAILSLISGNVFKTECLAMILSPSIQLESVYSFITTCRRCKKSFYFGEEEQR